MGGVSVEGGGSGSKLNTDLNLVPFIDLLSTLVLFLLVTAVWLQISAIPASVDSKGAAVANDTPPVKLEMRLTPAGIQLGWPGSMAGKQPATVGKKSGAYDLLRLEAILASAVKSNPKLTATVAADDAVEYGWVVSAVDVAKTAGIVSVALDAN